MQIKILFDSVTSDKKFLTGWGFSCLIDNSILFDTGENGDFLFNNMKKMNVDITIIKTVVISHDHWDHTRGLWALLRKNRGIIVYSCPGFDNSFKKNVRMLKVNMIENKHFHQIKENVYTTGEISSKYKGSYIAEQALIIKTAKGINVITGCSHPGIIKILDRVKRTLPMEKIYLVLGGFHLLQNTDASIQRIVKGFKERRVKKIGPAHCTGEKATELFEKEYKKNFVKVKAGQVINI